MELEKKHWLKNVITCKELEWNCSTKGGEKVLYWHWSPEYQWEMNFPLQGYNECLITYILAASSPTHAIDAMIIKVGLETELTLLRSLSTDFRFM